MGAATEGYWERQWCRRLVYGEFSYFVLRSLILKMSFLILKNVNYVRRSVVDCT